MDCSGGLNRKEVVIFFKAITDDISRTNIERIFKRIDTDNSDDLDFEEFKVRFSFFAYRTKS